MNLSKDISFRLITEADIPGADELRRLVGWNQTPSNWRAMLQLEPQGCFVALQKEQVVGTVTTISYGQALAWIGMMLVHPECRRQGIGRRLMQRAVAYLQGVGIKCIRLDATPAGFPLYEQLGFVTEWTLTRWQRPAAAKPLPQENPPPTLRRLTQPDWRAVREIDRNAFGVPRLDLLNRLARESLAALVWQPGTVPEGFGLLRPGANADYLGPLSCSSTEGFLALAKGLLAKVQNRSVFWDVPDQNEPAKNAAREFGFEPVRPLTRMRLGPNTVKSDPEAQFAIADPAVG